MDQEELALVPSLYGSGTTMCWLLTILASLVSWTCDKRKRKSDTLEADVIAIISFTCHCKSYYKRDIVKVI